MHPLLNTTDERFVVTQVPILKLCLKMLKQTLCTRPVLMVWLMPITVCLVQITACLVQIMAWAPGAALAAPLVDSRVGGLGLIGPSSTHPASVFYNPAAMILQKGHRVFFNGTMRLGTGYSDRRPIDINTGQPLPSGSQGRQSFTELFPQFFLGLSSDFDSEVAVLSITLHTPFAYQYSLLEQGEDRFFNPALQGPARYHVVDQNFYHIFLTTTGSFRIAEEISFGVSVSYVHGRHNFSFVRDAALEGGSARGPGDTVALDDCGDGARCGYESNAAAEAIRVLGHSDDIAFFAGILLQLHPSLDLGLSYASRLANVISNGDAWIRRSTASMANAGQDPELTVLQDLTGRGTLGYQLPDRVNFGATYRPHPKWLLNFQLHWINFSVFNKLDIRLTGPQFRQTPQIPDRIVHYRGFQDVIALQFGAGHQLTPTLQLQGAVMLETAAAPEKANSPALIDNTKVDAFVAAQWDFTRNLTLHGGYGLVLMPNVTVSESTFSPGEMVTCVDNSYNVDLQECQLAARGHGLPSTVGSYSMIVHRFALGLTYHYP